MLLSFQKSDLTMLHAPRSGSTAADLSMLAKKLLPLIPSRVQNLIQPPHDRCLLAHPPIWSLTVPKLGALCRRPTCWRRRRRHLVLYRPQAAAFARHERGTPTSDWLKSVVWHGATSRTNKIHRRRRRSTTSFYFASTRVGARTGKVSFTFFLNCVVKYYSDSYKWINYPVRIITR